ncbi:MAG: hypothetical protein ACI4KL_01920 [Lentihominibacter sp.]
MKQRNRARSSTLFLVELIIAILFFTVCSAVCVQFFVKSHSISRQAGELNFAVNECSSVAEIIQGSESRNEILHGLKSLYPEVFAEGTSNLLIAFDSDFSPCDPEGNNAAYYVNTKMKVQNNTVKCTISAENANSSESIYKLEILHNLQKEGTGEVNQ